MVTISETHTASAKFNKHCKNTPKRHLHKMTIPFNTNLDLWLTLRNLSDINHQQYTVLICWICTHRFALQCFHIIIVGIKKVHIEEGRHIKDLHNTKLEQPNSFNWATHSLHLSLLSFKCDGECQSWVLAVSDGQWLNHGSPRWMHTA